MSIKFSCASCGHRLKAFPEQAGKTCKCPSCGQTMTIPAAPPAAPVNRKRRLRLILGGAAAAAVLAGAIVLAVFLYGRFRDVDQKLGDLNCGAPEVRAQALLWLAQAQPQDSRRAQVTAALEPLVLEGDVQGNLDPDLVLRAYLHWANQDNVPAMIRMVEDHAMPCWNDKKTGQVMAALGKLQDKRAADALVGKLSDPRLHDQALDALRVLGPGAEGAVLDSLFVDDPDTQARAGELLAAYGTKPSTVIAEARRRLLSNDPEARRGAAAWLAENPPQDDAQKGEVAGALAGLLDDLSPQVNGLALRALKLWATRDCLPQVVAFAARQEKATDKDAVANNSPLIDVLAQVPDEGAAEVLALRLKDPAQRDKAAQALLKLGPVAVGPVLKYLDHPNADVRKEARTLCRTLNVPAARQVEQMLADVGDAHKPRSLTALQELARLRPDEASRVKVSRALNAPFLDADPTIRAAALDAVRAWGTTENTAALLKLLSNVCGVNNPDTARTVESISQTLISIGPGAEDAVIPLLRSSEPAVRGAACRVLADVGTAKSVEPLQDAGREFLSGDFGFYTFTQTAVAKIAARK
jgi:hypothetical protein